MSWSSRLDADLPRAPGRRSKDESRNLVKGQGDGVHVRGGRKEVKVSTFKRDNNEAYGVSSIFVAADTTRILPFSSSPRVSFVSIAVDTAENL
ncbi:hypothetical protein GW17_00036054 [Ensete ventricosum]|nr:hypothetical protein GW17_00036054 [Ensete ventricosum]RZR83131.1 hypothetical protein BHM03_00009676 [Ensete ventricosum]